MSDFLTKSKMESPTRIHVAILKNALEDMGAEVYIEDGNITIVKTGYVDDFVHIDGDGSISIHELEKGDGD